MYKNIIPYRFLLFARKLLKERLETAHNYAKVGVMCCRGRVGSEGQGKADKKNFILSHRCQATVSKESRAPQEHELETEREKAYVNGSRPCFIG